MDETPPLPDYPPLRSRVCTGCGKPLEACDCPWWMFPDDEEGSEDQEECS